MDTQTAVLLMVVALVVGIGLGQFIADLRRARSDAARVMRTRSNYRRGKNNQR